MRDDQPTRREADHALVDLQTGVADIQGGQAVLIKRVDRLDYAVFGIPETEEKGLLGEMREISAKLDRFLTVTMIAAAGIILSGLAIAVSIALNG